MQGKITTTELTRYLNKKFKEKKFLDLLYQELANVLSDPSIIPTLSAEEICDYIIEHRLLDKLIKSDTVPGEDPFKLRRKNGELIDEDSLDMDEDEIPGGEVWINVFIQDLVDLDYMMKDEDREFMEVRICVSFNGERLVTQGYPLANSIRIFQVS